MRIKRSTHQEDTIVNMEAPNKRAPKKYKTETGRIKGRNNSTIIIGAVNTSC